MRNKRGQVIEVFLGLILIILLIILVILFLNFPTLNKTTQQKTTTVVISQPVKQQYCEMVKVPQYKTTYYRASYDDDYPRHSYRTEHKTVRGILGNDIERYYVYVKNKDSRGQYFTVKFYFKDYSGDTKQESVTRYIPRGEEETFIYQDIYSDGYFDWDYEVVGNYKFSNYKYNNNYYNDYYRQDYITDYRYERKCYYI